MWHTSFNDNMMSYRRSQESKADIDIMLQSLRERAKEWDPILEEPFDQESEANIEIMLQALPERAKEWDPIPNEPFDNDSTYQQTSEEQLDLLPKLMEPTQEEACDVFSTNCEVVVEPQEKFTNIQQQEKCKEQLEEIIHLLEVALIEEALMNYKTSMLDEEKEEEEEVFQLYELPGKMLHVDKCVKQGVSSSLTPSARQIKNSRKEIEWKINIDGG